MRLWFGNTAFYRYKNLYGQFIEIALSICRCFPISDPWLHANIYSYLFIHCFSGHILGSNIAHATVACTTIKEFEYKIYRNTNGEISLTILNRWTFNINKIRQSDTEIRSQSYFRISLITSCFLTRIRDFINRKHRHTMRGRQRQWKRAIMVLSVNKFPFARTQTGRDERTSCSNVWIDLRCYTRAGKVAKFIDIMLAQASGQPIDRGSLLWRQRSTSSHNKAFLCGPDKMIQ